MLQSPLSAYCKKIQSGEIRPDPSQALAVEKLQSLHLALRESETKTGIKSLRDWFGIRRRPESQPKGIYIFGGVGRGKSMLMDLFFSAAPVKKKSRLHFHEFMQNMHCRLNEYRQFNGESHDPIPTIGKRFAKEVSLLCFDDFQVHDITDAMILSRLFEVLFEEGVVIIVTSNRPPSDLYKDGLQRNSFVPFIDLIEEKLDLFFLDSGTDYRRETIQRVGMYLMPNDKGTKDSLMLLFDRLTSDAKELNNPIIVNGRELNLPMASDNVALSDFNELCGATLGPADYLAIAENYHTLIICDIPQLGPESRDKAKRFVTLIDALYENNVKLICSAEVKPSELYIKGDGAFEFERTASRLIEMQSENYLYRDHADPKDIKSCKKMI